MTIEYSSVIQGCMGWGKWGAGLETDEMESRIHHCVSEGITSFDHADIYGDYTTEAEFGRAFVQSGVDRESIRLISKCGIQYVGNTRDNSIKHYQYDADYIIWSAEKSISDLKSDYLDLFLLHRPSPLIRPEEVAKAVDKLKSEGKIRAFGVSNFKASQMELLQSHVKIDVNQIEFSLTAHSAMWDGTLDFMQLHSIQPMCWSPLGSVFKIKDEQSERIQKQLKDLEATYGAGMDQLLLAWILKHPAGIIPVIGSSNPGRISKALAASKVDISEIDWFKLLVASQGHKVP